jgi:histidinol-phosphate aminotransferase
METVEDKTPPRPVELLVPHLQLVVRSDSADLRGSYVRLDRNERVTPISESEYQTLLGFLSAADLCHYPDPKPLQDRLAQLDGLAPGQALLTNGSDGAIRRLLHATLSPGDRVVMPNPTYEMYRVYAQIFQAKTVLLDYDEKLDLDVEELCRLARTHAAKVIALVTPDQPTGHEFTSAEISQVVREGAEIGAVVIVDEAYFHAGSQSATSLIARYPNLAVTRSYSKYLGFGGIRLGCLYGSREVIDLAVRVKGLHEVNGVALAVGRALLSHPEIVALYVAELEHGREVLAQFAQAHQLGFPRCPTTFQLLDLHDPARALDAFARLKDAGYLVRGFAQPALKGMLRVSLAGPQVMTSFTQTFAGILSSIRRD